jgi:peptidoglycan hydrolase-like protein with peptidoglycan-binding domain
VKPSRETRPRDARWNLNGPPKETRMPPRAPAFLAPALAAPALAAVALTFMPTTLAAQDLALILANDSYTRLPDTASSSATDTAARILGEAGFEVRNLRDLDLAGAAAGLRSARDDLRAADRVVVFVAGHVVNDGSRSWLLAPDARAPDPFTVGAQGVPLAPLFDMLWEARVVAVVLVADEDTPLAAGSGLAPGLAPTEPPHGVALFSGARPGLVALLRDEVLVPGRALGDSAADLPDGVEARGLLARGVAFLPAGEADRVTGTVTLPSLPVATLPPQAPTAEAIEAALQLDRCARRSVQRDLELLGFEPGAIDGLFGRGTRASLRRWQAANGLEATGYLTGAALVRLRDQGARRAQELEVEAAARQAEADRRDTAFWRETGEGGSEAGLRAYLERFPDGLYSDRARQQLLPFEAERQAAAEQADRDAWDRARRTDTAEAYRRYLDDQPDGTFRREAEAQLAARAPQDGTSAAQTEEQRVAGNTIVRLLVERRLHQLGGEPGRVDGVFDDTTRRAIRRFQAARELPATGYVSQATMARLLAQ